VPAGIDITPDGAFAYVANLAFGTVSVINTATNTITTTVPVGTLSLGLAVNPSGTLVYVPKIDGTISVIDTATNTVTATIPTGNGPTTVAFQKRLPMGSLIAQVQALVGGGVLTQNEADSLIKKLEGSQVKLDKGQTRAVCGQLGSFINQVNAFINNGSLTPSQGQALINAANAIKTSLGC
jgi:YVTN family beta-propeller protein